MTTIYDMFKKSGMTLVGLAGRKGSGKSTFARTLGKDYAFHVPMAFADPIRSVALSVFGCAYKTHEEKDAHDAYWAEKLGENWSTGRKILQHLGSELFRDGINKNIWTYCLERRLMALVAKVKNDHPKPLVTIDDLRYLNELEMVKNLGGKVIKLVNPNSPPNVDSHPSEAGLDDALFDHVYEVTDEESVERIARAHAFCLMRS